MRRPAEPPAALVALAHRQEDLVSSRQCDDANVTVGMRGRFVRSGRWVRLTQGVYDVAPDRDRRRDADHRRRRAAWLGMLAYGPSAIAVGACALALHGVGGLPLDITPSVSLIGGASRRGRDGMRVRQLAALESSCYGDRRISTLPYALLTAVPEIGRRHTVAVGDDLLRRGLLTPAELEHVTARLRGRRGCRGAGEWLGLVDARSESPLESFARLDCIDAGVPPDELQVVIRSADGAFLGRGDLGWRIGRGRWLIAEIDGREVHEQPEALLRDRARQNAMLLRGGVDLLRFTSADLATPGRVGRTVRAALLATRERHEPRSRTA